MTETLYDRVGGEEALHHLEELFYEKALADPVLKTLFTHRVPTHVDHLTWFTAESFGGPDRFTRELGFQHIIDVHRHLQITDEQRDRFVEAYMQALDEAGIARRRAAAPGVSRTRRVRRTGRPTELVGRHRRGTAPDPRGTRLGASARRLTPTPQRVQRALAKRPSDRWPCGLVGEFLPPATRPVSS